VILTYACHREWLRSIEEEEWLDSDEGGGIVRFTTLEKFCLTILRKVSLTDNWDDIIEKMSTDSAVQALLMMSGSWPR
jgi:hypothetical protein